MLARDENEALPYLKRQLLHDFLHVLVGYHHLVLAWPMGEGRLLDSRKASPMQSALGLFRVNHHLGHVFPHALDRQVPLTRELMLIAAQQLCYSIL